MNIVMWLLAGGALGWAAFTLLGFNKQRGTIVSIIIGAMGALIGGQMLAPMMSSSPILSGDFNVQALFIAAISASTPRDRQHDRTALRRLIAVARGAALLSARSSIDCGMVRPIDTVENWFRGVPVWLPDLRGARQSRRSSAWT